MRNDLIRELSDAEVPPVPATLVRGVHERVNRTLVVSHFVDLLCGALPFALGHLAQATIGLAAYTLKGSYRWSSKELGGDSPGRQKEDSL